MNRFRFFLLLTGLALVAFLGGGTVRGENSNNVRRDSDRNFRVNDAGPRELNEASTPRNGRRGARTPLGSERPSDKLPDTNSKNAAPAVVTSPEKPAGDFPLVGAIALVGGIVAASLLGNSVYKRARYGKNASKNLRGYKNAVSAQNELSKNWLKKGRSANIHAIGVGLIPGSEDFCIQVFVEDASAPMLEDPPTQLLPAEFRKLPVVVIEMPRAEFLNTDAELARQPTTTLMGGVSGANANLHGEVGTIGYFFRPNLLRRARKAFLQNHVYLLSNAHVFSDLTRAEANDSDLIMQPSPGDHSAGRVVATLYGAVPIDFSGDEERPNRVDAAIARLARGVSYSRKIPSVGEVEGFLRRDSVVLESACRKFGRTTGLTIGEVFSIHLSIWVRYPARGKEALFSEQFLIVPTDGGSFVKPGDSGSLVVDEQNRGIGLIFAGADAQTAMKPIPAHKVIGNFGVANSLGEVMKKFGIKI